MRPSPLRQTSTSSKRWLARQFRDPYVQQRVVHPAHFRSRSAFKLLELDDTFGFILPRGRTAKHQRRRVIVDLGAAPGGWSQVIALKYGFVPESARKEEDEPADMQFYGLSQQAKLARQGTWSDLGHNTEHNARSAPDPASPLPPTIIAVDLQRIAPIPGVHTLQADFLAPTTTQLIRALLLHEPESTSSRIAPIDLLLSDMAPNITGHAAADTEHALMLCEAVARFAETHLALGGTLVLKHFSHPTADYFRRTILNPSFTRVFNAKPPASRVASAEGYWVCVGYRGGPGARRVHELEARWQEDENRDLNEKQSKALPEIPTDVFQQSLPVTRKQRQRRAVTRPDARGAPS